MFHEDVKNDYIEYFIMDLYKNVMNLINMDNQSLEYKYTIEVIQEAVGMLDFLCRCRLLTDAEDEVIDMIIEELKEDNLINREEDKWRRNLKNWANYSK